MAFVESLIAPSISATRTGGGSNYIVETNAGALYIVFADANSDVVFSKSTDGGKTWATPTVIFTGTALQISVWFDKWSGLAGGLIHCAYTDTDSDDVFYRSIDTANSDALGTQTVIFAGASATGATSTISIARMRGGNLICCGTFDGGTENWNKKSTDVGGTWGDIAAVTESAANDYIILAPGFAADNQDALCIFYDASGTELSRKVYDDSANSWAETSIATSITSLVAGTAFCNYSMAVDLANSQLILAAWTAADLLNADLLVFTVNESAITSKTNVVTDQTDDQALAAVSIDTTNGDWYVYYVGAAGGAETFPSAVNIYYKKSDDDGATWGAQTKLTPILASRAWLITNPRMVYLSAELIAASQTATNELPVSVTSIMPTLPTEAQVESGVNYGINGVEFQGTFVGGGGGVTVGRQFTPL